jgi:hypothetical protein
MMKLLIGEVREVFGSFCIIAVFNAPDQLNDVSTSTKSKASPRVTP